MPSQPRAAVQAGLRPATRHFRVDARAILQLGRQSIRDHTTALVELVKNAYDADATLVEITIETLRDSVRVADNGVGMTDDVFDRNWLRIGYSAKRTSRRSPSGGRRVVGEKGVGRISADRLGAHLEVRTRASGAIPFSASVSWAAFDVDDRDLDSIPVTVVLGEEPKLPVPPSGGRARATGTELIITGLRQTWSAADVTALREELSALVSPFAFDRDFVLVLNTDVPGAASGTVESTRLERAELEFTGRFQRGVLSYEIVDRTQPRNPRKTSDDRRWIDLVQRARDPNARRRPKRVPKTGPVEIKLLYYPQHVFAQIAGGLRLRDIRDRTVGVKIYRDAVRVRPYGDVRLPEGDWLGLAARKGQDPAGVSRKTYRIPPTQLAGAVSISRDRNRELEDSASREGLIHNDAFNDLRALTLGCLGVLEGYRHTVHRERLAEQESIPAAKAVEGLVDHLKAASQEWRSIKSVAERDPSAAISRAERLVTTTLETARVTESSLSQLFDQTRLYRALSTLGISSSVFGHETQTAISMCLGNLVEARDELANSSPAVEYALGAVKDALVYAEKVNAWGAFAVARVRHDKRKPRPINLAGLAQKLIGELRTAFDATSTTIDPVLEDITVNGSEMDYEAILLNLLTNAYTFVQESATARVVRVHIFKNRKGERDGVAIQVSDSGPGVPSGARESIWEPLFTTKRDAAGNEVGSGLGLSIVDSIVMDAGGTREVDSDPELGGARFSIWFPLES